MFQSAQTRKPLSKHNLVSSYFFPGCSWWPRILTSAQGKKIKLTFMAARKKGAKCETMHWGPRESVRDGFNLQRHYHFSITSYHTANEKAQGSRLRVI